MNHALASAAYTFRRQVSTYHMLTAAVVPCSHIVVFGWRQPLALHPTLWLALMERKIYCWNDAQADFIQK